LPPACVSGIMDAGLSDIRSPALEQFGYLTTTGRRTGKPHIIEIWFAMEPDGRTVYMLSGGRDRADWVRNILRNPDVQFRIGSRSYRGRGRVVPDGAEERTARKLVVAKYYGRDYVHSRGWEATSLPVAVDLELGDG
jgi:deazaflavin-dependent oxidoreductase (nitroreductase family)